MRAGWRERPLKNKEGGRPSWLCLGVVSPSTSPMYLLSRHVRVVCQSIRNSTDTCALSKDSRPRTRCVYWRPCILPPPDEPKDCSAGRGDTLCTCVVEGAGMEGGETEEDDRGREKGNARIDTVKRASGCYYYL